MKQNTGPIIRLISNIISAPMPTRRMRHAVRDFVRQSRRPYKLIKQQWQSRGPALTPARYAEYDLVFVIGTSCAASTTLKAFGLRTFSSPLDWTAGITPPGFGDTPNTFRDTQFLPKVHALCTEFADYFEFDDFSLRASHDFTARNTPPHHPMINTRYNLMWWHHFPTDQSWERYFPAVRDKIMHRARRLCSEIDGANRILIVWAHRIGIHLNTLDAPVPDADIMSAMKMLNKKWPGKDFDMVFFEHDGNMARFEFDKIAVCDGAYRVRSNHFDRADEYTAIHPVPDPVHTAPLVMSEMLDNIKLRRK